MSRLKLTRREMLLAAAAPALAQNSKTRPNIVLILGDQLGAWMLGIYGNREIRTPNLDLLARTGTRFLFHFGCAPVAAANRFSIYTGRPSREGAKPDARLSDLLANHGYQCGSSGLAEDGQVQYGPRVWEPPSGGERAQPSRMEFVTAGALHFLEGQKQDRPFYLEVNYADPHTPFDGIPPKYQEAYANVSFNELGWEPLAANAVRDKDMLRAMVPSIRKCAAAVTALDTHIEVIVTKLDRMGIRTNTLIIFTSASGFLLGRHGLWSDGLASDPINMYDEVMATPLIWSWPSRVPVEAMRPELVSSYDLVPSLCELTGAALPAGLTLPGRSYLPAVFNEPFPKKNRWRNTVFGEYRDIAMVRDQRYKLVLRNGGKGPNELYAVRADPREKMNQYDNPSFITVRDQLAAELAAWRKASA